METNKQNNSEETKEIALTDIKDVFDALKEYIHAGNVKRGFYDKEPSDCEQLALIMTECAEAIEADRKNKHANLTAFLDEINKIDPKSPDAETVYEYWFRKYMKDTVEDEVADHFIRGFDYCGWRGIDIASYIIFKLQFNATRPYKHGKQY